MFDSVTWSGVKKRLVDDPRWLLHRLNNRYLPRPEPVIAVGFDGLLCNSQPFIDLRSRWIVDPPTSGAISFLLQLIAVRDVRVAVYDARSNTMRGRRAMRSWVAHWGAAHFLHSLPQTNTPFRDNNHVIQLHNTLPLWVDAGYLTPQQKKDIHEFPVGSGEHVHAGNWLARQLEWPKRHPRARVTVDARSMRFNGKFPEVEEVIQFRVWNQQQDPL